MESNARYYSRRAVEERMKAQRAITEAARSWHAKLAEDFAERASVYASNPDTAFTEFTFGFIDSIVSKFVSARSYNSNSG